MAPLCKTALVAETLPGPADSKTVCIAVWGMRSTAITRLFKSCVKADPRASKKIPFVSATAPASRKDFKSSAELSAMNGAGKKYPSAPVICVKACTTSNGLNDELLASDPIRLTNLALGTDIPNMLRLTRSSVRPQPVPMIASGFSNSCSRRNCAAAAPTILKAIARRASLPAPSAPSAGVVI